LPCCSRRSCPTSTATSCPDIYGATTQILLKDQEVYDYQSQVYKSLGYAGVYGDLVNQKRVLTSYDLVDEALDKLDFDVSYFIVGRFKTTQVYGTLPFTCNIEVLETKLYERPLRPADRGCGPVMS
jgi:tyrosine-protein kinase Etk/Wzc